MVRLQFIVDFVGVSERLRLGVDGSGKGGTRGVHTGILPVLDQ